MNSVPHDRQRPPIDPAVLAGLRQDVGQAALGSVIRTYIELLVLRLSRIEQSMARHEIAEALATLVDLRTTSAMLGARRMVELLENVEHLLGLGQAGAAVVRLPGLRTEAAAVVSALLMESNGNGNGRREGASPPSR